MVRESDEIVWLPRGFEFLSGLPERLRRKRPIVLLQAFIDDSGTKNDGPAMVVAAVIGPAEIWAAIADKWDKEIRSSVDGRLKYFKEDEAVHLAGEFRHWREEARDRKVQRLSRILNRPELLVVWFGVDLDAHRSASKFAGHPLKGVVRHGGNQPYLLLMPGVMMGVCVAARRILSAQKLELILDEQNIFKDDIRSGYNDVVRLMPDDVRPIMPAQPLFRDDEEFLPLQAADMIAGTVRRRILGDPKRLTLYAPLIKEWLNSKFLDGNDMLKFAQAHTKKRLFGYPVNQPQRKR